MADFIQDNSNLGFAASALQGFAGAYKDAQDDQVKRQEAQAKLSQMKAQADRDATDAALKLRVAGYQKTQGGGPSDLEEAPMSPSAQGKQKLDVFKAGGAGEYDENGNLTGVSVDPASLNMMKIRNQNEQRQATRDMQGRRLDLMGRRFEEVQSQNAAGAGNKITDDKIITDLTASRNSLASGRRLLDGKSPLTYNNLNAVQQDVINGMTRGAQSSEGKVSREMQESWIGRWNNLKAKAGEYGEDNDIRTQDPGLYKQIKGLLDEVDNSSAKNISARTKALASSYGQTSNKRQKAIVEKKVQDADAEANPEGLVGKGLVNPPGLVGGQPAQTTAPDPDAVKYAQMHGMDINAASKIVADRKAAMRAK